MYKLQRGITPQFAWENHSFKAWNALKANAEK